jgi:hypothetical protein
LSIQRSAYVATALLLRRRAFLLHVVFIVVEIVFSKEDSALFLARVQCGLLLMNMLNELSLIHHREVMIGVSRVRIVVIVEGLVPKIMIFFTFIGAYT